MAAESALKERWRRLVERLGLKAEDELERLWAAYQQPHRGYHNLEHIADCLALLDASPAPAKDWLELALWYHDAVYQPQASDNEERSADWAVATLQGSELPVEPVRSLILVTKHTGEPSNELEQWMLDLDLAILGADGERFQRYEDGVRQEYAWVPEAFFRLKRKEILQRFLARPRLYHFLTHLEEPARANLARAIEALSNTAH